MHSYVFSVAVSWGNKMNFSLYVNMAGFCLDSTNTIFNPQNLCRKLPS